MSKSVTKNKKRKVTRSSPKKQGRVLALTMIAAGILLVSFWLVHKLFYYRSLSLSRMQANIVVHELPKVLPLPTHVFIPWNTDTDIESLPYENNQWQVSDSKVTYLLGSARPGEAGNIILYGHNKREILGNIRALKGGEKVTLTTGDGKVHTYVVNKVKEVDPTDVSLLAPTSTETLTMYTCSGFWDSRRFIVQAKPLEN